jgi:hypothetical protein
MGWNRTRHPKHCCHFWSTVRPHPSCNNCTCDNKVSGLFPLSDVLKKHVSWTESVSVTRKNERGACPIAQHSTCPFRFTLWRKHPVYEKLFFFYIRRWAISRNLMTRSSGHLKTVLWQPKALNGGEESHGMPVPHVGSKQIDHSTASDSWRQWTHYW